MGLFQAIHLEARRRELRFLVIGGLAVNFYGFSRDTADLDLLILRDQRADWLDLFSGLAYTVDHDAGTFIQLAPPKQEAWPVDLMLVQPSTFLPMFDQGRQVEMLGAQLFIPSLEHLMALKLHALKHGNMGRFLKDFLDVEHLVRANKVDLQSADIRRLFLKYGNPDLYEKISRACAAR